MRTIVRVLFGLTIACLTAALVKVLHVITPMELANLEGDALLARFTRLGELVLLTATHQALFILPFALIAVTVAEFNRWRGWLTYAFLGLLVAAAGFYLQYSSENEVRTIVNEYAARAYVIEGIVAGLAYWLVAGRFAGWRRGGGLIKTKPYPLDKPKLQIKDVDDVETGAGVKQFAR